MKQLSSRHVLLLVVATALLFANSLANGFVLDDLAFIVTSDFLKKFDLVRLLTTFSAPNVIEYFPLRDATVMLDYSIWKENPFGFHLTNLFLYCLNVVTVYALAREVTLILHRDDRPATDASIPAAFLCAILFAAHPLHCEVVDAVFNRGALLAGLFFFGACVFFLRFLRHENVKSSWWWYGGALLCFLLALLSKHYVIILPLLLVYFVFLSKSAKGRTRSALPLIPFFLLSVFFYVFFKTVALRTGVLSPEFARLGTINLVAAIAKSLQIPFFYVKMLVAPFGFSVMYEPKFSSSLVSPATIFSLLACGMIMLGAFKMRRAFPELLFGLCWFFITLIPVLNFFNTIPMVADRYAYIPSLGFFYVLAAVLARISAGRRVLAIICSGLLVVIWAGLAVRQNLVWKDSMSLWNYIVRKSPSEGVAYLNLGTAYFDRGDNEKALLNYRKAQELSDGGEFRAIYSEGGVHLKRGDYQAAIDCFSRALSIDEEYLDANFTLASVYERLGNNEKAVYHYNRVLFSQYYMDEGDLKARARQKVHLLAKEVPRLISLQQAVAVRPDDLDIRKDLALTLDTLAMYDDALAVYQELERRGGGRWQLYFNIANVCRHLQRKQEAVAYYEKCFALNSTYADAWNGVGTVYDSLGEGTLAIAAFRKAIECDAASSYPYFNLAKAYLRAGDVGSARSYFSEVQRRFPALRAQAAPYVKQFK